MAEKMYFQEFGQGEPLVLLHGYPLDHTIWLRLVPYLEKECRIILPDLRGHGKSPAPAGPYSMKSMAEDVVTLLDTLGIEKSVFAGHSMGGYVSIAAARFFQERLSALALVASNAYADSPEKKESRLSSISIIEKEGIFPTLSGMPEMLSYNKDSIEFIRHLISGANRKGVIGVLTGMAERPDSTELLSNLDIPIMIIAGQKDQIISIETSRKMACEISDAQLIEVPDAGHMPMLDNPILTADALISLIKSL